MNLQTANDADLLTHLSSCTHKEGVNSGRGTPSKHWKTARDLAWAECERRGLGREALEAEKRGHASAQQALRTEG